MLETGQDFCRSTFLLCAIKREAATDNPRWPQQVGIIVSDND
jgi:hypothetical protein